MYQFFLPDSPSRHPLPFIRSDRGMWVVISALFALGFFLRLWQYGWVANDDGVVYLYAAKTYQLLGFEAAYGVYDWPYYSIFIALFDRAIPGNLLVSAWALNFVFQAVQIVFIYRLCRIILGRGDVVLWVILLFVISTAFHNFRIYLLRDQGFIACVIGGIYFAVVYLQSQRVVDYFLFLMAFVLSLLFRVEGCVLLIFGVVGVVLFTKKYLHFFCLLIAVFGLVLVGLMSPGFLGADAFLEQIMRRVSVMGSQLGAVKEALESQVFPKYWQDYGGVAVFSMYLGTFIFHLLANVSWYLFGAGYVRLRLVSKEEKLITCFAVAVLTYCLAMLLANGFLIYRYSLLLTYLAVIIVIYQLLIAVKVKRPGAKWALGLILLVSLVKFFGLPSGGKQYLNEAQAVVSGLRQSNLKVLSNTWQISFMNGVDYEEARELTRQLKRLEKKAAKPLREEQVLVIYRDNETQLKINDNNCLLYSNGTRSKELLVITGRGLGCD